MSALPTTDEMVATRRLNINLPDPVFKQLQTLAEKSGGSMTSVVKNALSLVRIAYEELDKGNKLAVVSPDGKVSKEIVLVR